MVINLVEFVLPSFDVIIFCVVQLDFRADLMCIFSVITKASTVTDESVCVSPQCWLGSHCRNREVGQSICCRIWSSLVMDEHAGLILHNCSCRSLQPSAYDKTLYM